MNVLHDLKAFVFDRTDKSDHEPLDGVPCFNGWKKGEMTEEHRKNLSIAASNRKRTKDHLEKLHAGRRRSKNTPEHTAAIVAAHVDVKHTDETKSKMSAAAKKAALKDGRGKRLAENRGKDVNYSELMKAVWAKRRAGTIKMPARGG